MYYFDMAREIPHCIMRAHTLVKGIIERMAIKFLNGDEYLCVDGIGGAARILFAYTHTHTQSSAGLCTGWVGEGGGGDSI